MKKVLLACAVVVATTGVAHAQATPEHEFSYNVGVVSDYRFRGVSQTTVEPALQGGIDYAHTPSGFYAGTWASTIKWIKDAGGSSDVELNFYAGKTGEFGNGLSYDFGGLAYVYPGRDLNADTFEVYGQLGYGPAYVKYSHTLTDLFGIANSKGSGYLDVGASFELTYGISLNLHAGHQMVKNAGPGADYTDWSIGVSKDFGMFEASLAYIDTDLPRTLAGNGKNITGGGVVLSLSKSF